MEIKIKINGEFKTFKQDTINFLTIRKALEWQERMDREMKLHAEILTSGIDEDIDVHAEFDPYEDMNFTAELVVDFFSGQFTYDEFATGAYFKDIREFYELGSKIFELAFLRKEETEQKKPKALRSMK